MRLDRFASLTTLALLFASLAVINAQAGEITIYDTQLQAWKVSWTAPNVAFADTTPGQNEEFPLRTTNLSETKSFPNLDPITVLFEQQASNVDEGGSGSPNPPGGLNFLLQATVTNNDTQVRNWYKYRVELNDLTPLVPGVGGFHPDSAHFHYPGPPANRYNSSPLTWADGQNPDNFFLLSDGVVTPGSSLTYEARIHDIIRQNKLSRFEMIQIPVPEPATWTLAILGISALFALRARRK